MKKIWLIFALTVIIAAQVTFMYSFRSTSITSEVTGTSAVVVSKMKYAYMRASIYIFVPGYNSSVVLEFSNGTQKEITGYSYNFEVFLPRSGDFMGDYQTASLLVPIAFNPFSSGDYPKVALSQDHPIDVDVIPNVSSDFLSWYDNSYTDYSENIDIYWFKIHGDAQVHISGYGVAI